MKVRTITANCDQTTTVQELLSALSLNQGLLQRDKAVVLDDTETAPFLEQFPWKKGLVNPSGRETLWHSTNMTTVTSASLGSAGR